MKARRLLPLVVAAHLLAGCQGVPIDFSGRTVQDRAAIDPYQGRRIAAEATGFQLLFFIPLAINDRQRQAYDALLREAGTNMLADVTVTESWRWGFVGTFHTTRIEATAYPRVPPAPAGSGNPAY